MAEQTNDQDLEHAIGAAELLLNLLGSGNSDVVICRNLVDGQGIDPGAVRDAVRRSVGAPMTPMPDRLSESDLIEWGSDGGVLRAPIWTEAGPSHLQITVTVRPTQPEPSPWRLWGCFVSGVIDEHGTTMLTPGDGLPHTPPINPGWSEPTDGHSRDDARIHRGAFTGSSHGILLGQVVDGVYRVHPDALGSLDQLTEGQSAILLLETFFSGLYGDGINAAFRRLAVDRAPHRLTAAAGLVGAAAYAEVLARVEQSLPSDVRESATAMQSYLEGIEAAAWDADEEDRTLQAYEDQIFRLEDDGDLIWQHMVRYVEQQPDQFFTPE